MAKSKRCKITGRYLPDTETFKDVEGDIMAKGVYQIKNIENNRIYIGACYSNTFKTRWLKHIDRLRHNSHKNKNLQADWVKYGQDVFKFSILESIDLNRSEVYAQEKVFIDKLIDWEKDYNVHIRKFSEKECLNIIDYYLSTPNVVIADLCIKFNASENIFSNIFSGCYPSCKTINKIKLQQCQSKAQDNIRQAAQASNTSNRKLSPLQAGQLKWLMSKCNKRTAIANHFNINTGTLHGLVSGRTYGEYPKVPCPDLLEQLLL